MTTTETSVDLRRQLVQAVVETFQPEEEILPGETVCQRLTTPVTRYLPDSAADDAWEPHDLAAALRRLGVFDFWPAPHDGLHVSRENVLGLLECVNTDPAKPGAPAFDEKPWMDGTRFTTSAGDQVDVYPLGPDVAVQVIGSSCAAPEVEVIASFTPREVGLLIAALQAMCSSDPNGTNNDH